MTSEIDDMITIEELDNDRGFRATIEGLPNESFYATDRETLLTVVKKIASDLIGG